MSTHYQGTISGGGSVSGTETISGFNGHATATITITGTATADLTLNVDGTYSGTYRDIGTVSVSGTDVVQGESFPFDVPDEAFDTGDIVISGSINAHFAQVIPMLGASVSITASFSNGAAKITTSGHGTISNFDGLSGSVSAGATLTGALTPMISIDSGSASVAEGGVATYTITRGFIPLGGADSSVTVMTIDGVASAGTNYVFKTETINFTGTQSSAKFTVQTLHDGVPGVVNPDFAVVLSDPQGATIGFDEADTTILNTDIVSVTPSGVTTDQPNGTVVHAGNTVKINVQINNPVHVGGSGNPIIKLSDGGTAVYNAGESDTSTGLMVFDYIVLTGQATPVSGTGVHADLMVTSITLPKGTTVTDDNGKAVNLSGAAKANLHISVDGIAPIVKEGLLSDTGTSKTDKITQTAGLTGSGDANALVHFNIDGSDVLATANASAKGAWTISGDTLGLVDGLHTIIASETDDAGNTGTASLTFTLDTTSPTVQSVSTTAGAGAHIGLGQTTQILIDLGGGVKVTGAPTLTLSDGETASYSAAMSDAANGIMAFTYKAGPGHTTTDLQVSSINLGKASVTDLAGNPADFSGLGAQGDIALVVDTAPPLVDTIAVNNPPASERVALGQTIEIDLTANEPLAVSGAPTLTLSDGGIATYDAGESDLANGVVAFDYTPSAGHNSADLMVKALTIAKGSAITDLAGNLIVAKGAANKDLAVAVDTNSPTIMAVDEFSSPSLTGPIANGAALKSGDIVYFKATVKDSTAGDSLQIDDPNFSLVLNDGQEATYDQADSNPAGGVLVFKYTIGNESTTDLKVVGFDFSGGGSAADLAGNPLAISTKLIDHKNTVNVFTWTNKSGGSFDTGSNWTPQGPPVAGNTALITAAGTYTVTAGAETLGMLSTAKGATLSISGNGNMFAATAGGTNAGTINVGDGSVFVIGGVGAASNFVNSGKITLNSSGNQTAFGTGNEVTLSGHGTILLGDNSQNVIGNSPAADTSLINVDNKIIGSGIIGDNPTGGHHFTFTNQAKGLVQGNGANSALTISLTNGIQNFGTLEGTSAQGLRLSNDTIDNAMLIAAIGTDAHLVIENTTINNTSKGIVEVSGTNAHLDLSGATISGGAIKIIGSTAMLETDFSLSNSHISVSSISNAGTIQTGSSELTLDCNLTNLGTVQTGLSQMTINGDVSNTKLVDASIGAITINGDVTNKGTMTLDYFLGSHSNITGNVSNTGTMSGADIDGNLTNSSKFFSESHITGNATNTGTMSGRIEIDGNLVNNGTVNVSNFLHIGGTDSGHGTIHLTGTISVVELDGAASNNVIFDPGLGHGTLKLGDSLHFTGMIAGLAAPFDFIEFSDVDFINGFTSFSYTANSKHTSGVLNVSDGIHSGQVTILGNHVQSDFGIMDSNDALHHVDLFLV